MQTAKNLQIMQQDYTGRCDEYSFRFNQVHNQLMPCLFQLIQDCSVCCYFCHAWNNLSVKRI